jgi:hypothetical protein
MAYGELRRISYQPAPSEEAAEAAVANLVGRKILVLRHEPVAEALVRFAIPRVLTGNFTPSIEALEVFKQRRVGEPVRR